MTGSPARKSNPAEITKHAAAVWNPTFTSREREAIRLKGATAVTETPISNTSSPTVPIVDGVRIRASATAVKMASSCPYTMANSITVMVTGTNSARHGSIDKSRPNTIVETQIVR